MYTLSDFYPAMIAFFLVTFFIFGEMNKSAYENCAETFSEETCIQILR